jgi:structural maintenance of chromosome 4
MVEETSNGVAKSGTSHAPRLVIQEMILENFKSYAGEQRVGPFHKVCP